MLEDIWRVQNPENKRYSWYRIIKSPKKYIQASRIDYALIPQGSCKDVHNCFYLNGIKSDHSAFFLGIDHTNEQRGRGYWKLNVSSLADPEMVELINSRIEDLKVELDGLTNIDKWEVFKNRIRTHIQKLSRKQRSEEKVAISQLSEYVTETEERLDELEEEEIDLLEKSKNDLEELVQKSTLGIMFRSKARWAMEGERNTQYFYNLEKSRYNAKTCTSLFNESWCNYKE